MSVEVPQIPVDPGEHYAGDMPTEQRPPVPGEENIETVSNDGCSSQYSHYSNKTVITKTELTHSPAATPRRSNIDHGKYAMLLQCQRGGVKGTEDIEAPLGFEPEGSASVTPPYTRWAESFRALLDDSEGINLFREFLQQEKDEDSLLFWFACQGFRNKLASDPTRAGTGKVIYKNFIKLNGPQTVKLSEQTRNYIAQDLNKTPITPGLFDQAQSEIEDLMRETTYPMFLKSEIYVQYVQNGGLSSPKCESSSNSSNSRYPTGYLPTVHEDAELCCDVKPSTSDSEKQVPLSLTSEMLAATRYARMGLAENHKEGRHLKSTLAKVISPYHPSLASHAPATSTNDSELQSLSSDAISTDDTMSLTDSSVDGFPTTRRREQRRRREMRSMTMNMKQNGCIKSFPPFPHSQRRPKEIQPMEPKQFAAILTKKLEDYLKQLETTEKLDARIRKLDLEELQEEENQHMFVSSSAPMVKTLPPEPAKSFPISSDDTTSGVEEDPNSIIEEHFSRVFDSSGKHTPHGYWSPGRHTPKSKSPDRAFRKVAYHGTPQLPATMLQKLSHQQQLHKSRHANRDSGTITIYDTETGMAHLHKHHHHHHVHHHTSTKTKHQIEAEATQRSMAVFGVDPAETIFNPKSRPRIDAVNTTVMETVLESSRHKRESKKSSKKSDASVTSKTTSGVDSGIFEGPVSLPPSDSGSERNRVMDWIQESEVFTRNQQQQYAEMVSKTRDPRHKRPQHKLPSQSPSPSPHRMGTSKKPVTYSTSRQSSTERPYNVQAAWVKNKPAQPIMQDPSMPVNPPPDPLSVLEEARRRIDDEKKLKHPKTKHPSEASRKDRRPSTLNTQSQISRSATATPKNVPPEVEQVEEDMKVQQSSNNSTMKKSSRSSKSTSTSNRDSENTVVAYFFCSEPIPYRTSILGKEITLAQFKSLITKKGHYQYVFKKASDEFECGVVHEIICDDSAILPIFEGKIVGKVEKID